MKKKITCIVCPRGCMIEVTQTNGSWTVTGNACKRGEKHAIDECTNPVRTVTSTVRVCNRDTMLPVKTAAPIPKDAVFATMEKIRSTQVTAPIKIGDVILEDVFGTQIIATGEMQ